FVDSPMHSSKRISESIRLVCVQRDSAFLQGSLFTVRYDADPTVGHCENPPVPDISPDEREPHMAQRRHAHQALPRFIAPRSGEKRSEELLQHLHVLSN